MRISVDGLSFFDRADERPVETPRIFLYNTLCMNI